MQWLSQGVFRLFRLFGIEVSLHWSWLPVEALLIYFRQREYPSLAWNVGECLSLFAIVLLHELGHALACRSVGGRAERILLTPLGGVAFVSPPARPGAVLWSIAAGPLVNLLLLPLCAAAAYGARFAVGNLELANFFTMLAWINGGLLVFNLLPVYPLDGGRILESILWLFVGRVRALRIAATLGLAAMLVGLGLSLYAGRSWLIVMALFGAARAWDGLRQANSAARLAAEQPTYDPR